MFIYTDEELGDADQALELLIAETDADEKPHRRAMLVRASDVITGYITLRNALQTINTLPGRQIVGHAWIARLTSILREIFGG